MSAPVLSWLFTAPGKPEAPLTSNRGRRGEVPKALNPCMHTARASGSRTLSPQSQSFSRSYGSILPTSLIYIVLSARGCSPWRPDAVMSTTRRDWYPLPQIFMDHQRRAGHRETCGALPVTGPYLRVNRFQGLRTVKKKRELFPGPLLTSPGSLTLPSATTSWFGNINPIPFRWAAQIALLIRR